MTGVSDAWTDPLGATLDVATGAVISETYGDAVSSDLLYLFKRRVVELTNRSGASVAAGDVVTLDPGNDSSFTTTTTQDSDLVVGVAAETINNAASGKVIAHGLASVNVNATTSRGNWITTSTTAKQGRPTAVNSGTAFARAVASRSGAGLVNCLLLGPPMVTASLAPITVTKRDVVATTVVNTNAETSVFSETIPANSLGSTGDLRIRGSAAYINSVGADHTLEWRFKYGGTTFALVSIDIPSATWARAIEFEVHISGRNATNAQYGEAWVAVYGVNSSFAAGSAGNAASPACAQFARFGRINDGMAIDSTANQTLEITVKHDAGDPNLQFALYRCHVELLP